MNAFGAQDRVMLDLRNSGAIVMNVLDTSVTGAMPYQIRTANDRMSFQQFGGNRAGFAIFGDSSDHEMELHCRRKQHAAPGPDGTGFLFGFRFRR